jgi:fructosamine-3-kinase
VVFTEFSSLNQALEALFPDDPLLSKRPCGTGGCINSTFLAGLNSGKLLFLKENTRSPENMFREEARGLIAFQRNSP